MEYFIKFVTGLFLTVTTSLIVVAYFNEKLNDNLKDVCGTEQRAKFWAGLCNFSIVSVPLTFTLFNQNAPEKRFFEFYEIIGTYRWSLIGLMSMLGTIGIALSLFVKKASEQ